LIIILVVGFLLIQVIPYGRSHQNPPVVKEPAWDSPQTRALAKRACFDCHSNETVWPWYSNIAPVSWLTQRDTNEGRQRLNYSDWQGIRSERGREGGNELTEVIQKGSMPPWYYVMIHPTAKLSDQEKQQLITGLQNSLK
jgi:cytochrome c551/c552